MDCASFLEIKKKFDQNDEKISQSIVEGLSTTNNNESSKGKIQSTLKKSLAPLISEIDQLLILELTLSKGKNTKG